GQALIAFALEMVLGGPKAVIAELVHQPRHVARRPEHLAQPLVRVPPVVRGRAVKTDIVERDLADIEAVKPSHHLSICSPQLVRRRIAAATSSGLSSSARWPASAIVANSVGPAIPRAKRSA